jgi:uncharacterized protein (TIGR00299 family) protein
MKGGLRATKVDVYVHEHGGAGAGHHQGYDAGRHPHRTLPVILDLIGRSGLDAGVKRQAAAIFQRLGEAEARVHGTTPSEVQFHDVGAVDAIVDVVGACAGLHLLGVEAVHTSALPAGGGMVDGPHGRIPVPAPATAELVRGFPLVDTGVKRELVTPTGAAILTTLSRTAGTMPAMTVSAVGYGAGTIDLETPNVVRVFLGETTAAADVEHVVQVEATIDDMSPQLYEPLIERLLVTGALDVWLAPVIMKKSRPGVVVTALTAPDGADGVVRVLFEETTTIGVRWTAYDRRRLPREMVTVDTSLGPVTFKLSRLDGRVVTATPEFDQVRRLAGERGLSVREALDRVRADSRRLLE